MHCDHSHFHYNKSVLVQRNLGAFFTGIQCAANNFLRWKNAMLGQLVVLFFQKLNLM